MGENALTEPWHVTCSECGEPIDVRNLKSFHQQITGHVRKRDQGGPNHVELIRYHDSYICNPCMRKLLDGVNAGQLELSGNA